MDNLSDYITTQEAAELLGVSARRVLALIKSKRLPAITLGKSRVHVIRRADLKLDKVKNRKPGRPWPSKEAKPRGK